jgi:hypothetical protein
MESGSQGYVWEKHNRLNNATLCYLLVEKDFPITHNQNVLLSNFWDLKFFGLKIVVYKATNSN